MMTQQWFYLKGESIAVSWHDPGHPAPEEGDVVLLLNEATGEQQQYCVGKRHWALEPGGVLKLRGYHVLPFVETKARADGVALAGSDGNRPPIDPWTDEHERELEAEARALVRRTAAGVDGWQWSRSVTARALALSAEGHW